jgi:hypothetical protein
MNKLVLIALICLVVLASATKVTYKTKVKEDNCSEEPDAEGWYHCTYADDYQDCSDKWRYDNETGSSESEYMCVYDNGDGTNCTNYNYYHSSMYEDGTSNGNSNYMSQCSNRTDEGGCSDWSWWSEETNESSGGSSCWGWSSEGDYWSSWSEWSYGEHGDENKNCWTNEDGEEDCWTCTGWYDDDGTYTSECYEGHEHEHHDEDDDCEYEHDQEQHHDDHFQKVHESASIVGELSMMCGCGSDTVAEWATWDGEDYHCHTVCTVEEELVDPLWESGLLD